ncbi:GAF and ANTAR domain-containing protein [Kitasatospora purpeofusca]|uniref:GAF and ANTAR domain-containing protein n=1 Tax=Kitasatospora purpeofusca TaxID=67352 RepID=UPI002E15DBCB|nr:GAF and ANTAR domain-containing protein [Kitasatospora purpeofusca]
MRPWPGPSSPSPRSGTLRSDAGSWAGAAPARQPRRRPLCAGGRVRRRRPALDVTVAAPWQPFASRARAAGFVTANAVPMRLRGRVIGALGLFRSEPGRLRPEDVLLAQALADVATVAILQQRTLADSETERAQLQYALTSRIVIEQVKGILAERWRVPLDDAFAALRSYTRANRLQLAALARDIADAAFDTRRIPRPQPADARGGPAGARCGRTSATAAGAVSSGTGRRLVTAPAGGATGGGR